MCGKPANLQQPSKPGAIAGDTAGKSSPGWTRQASVTVSDGDGPGQTGIFVQAGVMMSMGNKKVVKIACRPLYHYIPV